MKSKKERYIMLMLVSLGLMSADGDNFLYWIVWELCCCLLLLFSIYMYETEKEKEQRKHERI